MKFEVGDTVIHVILNHSSYSAKDAEKKPRATEHTGIILSVNRDTEYCKVRLFNAEKKTSLIKPCKFSSLRKA